MQVSDSKTKQLIKAVGTKGTVQKDPEDMKALVDQLDDFFKNDEDFIKMLKGTKA